MGYTFIFSPSRIGNYFDSGCKRRLAYESIHRETNDKNVAGRVFDCIVENMDEGPMLAGEAWEREVLKGLGEAVIYKNGRDFSEKFDPESTKDYLKNLLCKELHFNNQEIFFSQMCLGFKNKKIADSVRWGDFFIRTLSGRN